MEPFDQFLPRWSLSPTIEQDIDHSYARALLSEHLPKNTKQLIERSLGQSSQSLGESFPIFSPQLISHNVTVFTIKRATHKKRIWMIASC